MIIPSHIFCNVSQCQPTRDLTVTKLSIRLEDGFCKLSRTDNRY